MFGAAVRPDGSASPTLARRTGYALAAAESDPAADLFCSGGVGRFAPSEAAVMAALLAGQVDPARIHIDEASRDTLETVRAAAAFVRRHGYAGVLSCTDAYHQPRVRMLFALQRIACTPVRLQVSGRSAMVRRMRLREAAAIPYDLVAGTAAALVDRLRRR